jgi:hypothetical protein
MGVFSKRPPMKRLGNCSGSNADFPQPPLAFLLVFELLKMIEGINGCLAPFEIYFKFKSQY